MLLVRIALGLLLMVHGIAHWEIARVWGSRPAPRSWLLPGLGLGESSIASLANLLSVAAMVLFVASGLGVWVGLGWWRGLALTGSLVSLLVIALYWDPKMILGVAIAVGILMALLWAGWPSKTLIGS